MKQSKLSYVLVIGYLVLFVSLNFLSRIHNKYFIYTITYYLLTYVILFLDDDDDSTDIDDVYLSNVESNVVVGDDEDED